jgi:hypothetical protein
MAVELLERSESMLKGSTREKRSDKRDLLKHRVLNSPLAIDKSIVKEEVLEFFERTKRTNNSDRRTAAPQRPTSGERQQAVAPL